MDLNGPVPADLGCTLGVACSLQLEGLGLFSTNRIRIVEAQAGSCGSSTPTVTTMTGMTVDAPVTNTAPYGDYSFGIPQAGSSSNAFRLCWGPHLYFF